MIPCVRRRRSKRWVPEGGRGLPVFVHGKSIHKGPIIIRQNGMHWVRKPGQKLCDGLGHEGGGTPKQVYQPSPQPYPAKLPPIEYGSGTVVRHVRHNGEIRWRAICCTCRRFWPRSPWGSRQWAKAPGRCYSFHPLGTLKERTLTLTPARQWHQPDTPQAM